MTTLLQEEERLGQLLLQLADVDADLVIQLDPETGGETTVWPVNFTTPGNSVQCTATLYERFNGTVVLRIDADVQTVVDSAEVRRDAFILGKRSYSCSTRTDAWLSRLRRGQVGSCFAGVGAGS